MKRKVVKQGQSSFVISLPNEWVKRNQIQKGDLLEVEDTNNILEVSKNKLVKGNLVEIDISGLNRTSILVYIRSVYRRGYDEINVKFSSRKVMHFRKGEELSTYDVIAEALTFLIGVEIVSQTENKVTIKQISVDSDESFKVMLDRIVLLMVHAFKEAQKALETNDDDLLLTVENHRKSIHKFVSYCMRLINKGAKESLSDSLTLYHMLSTYGKIIDALKEIERYKIDNKVKFIKEGIPVVKMIVDSIELFQKLYSKRSFEVINQIEENRSNFRAAVSSMETEKEMIAMLEIFREVTELIQELVECRLRIDSI